MKILVELDDLHPNPEVDCLELVEELLTRNPSLILNFFVPAMYKDEPLSDWKHWCQRLKTLVDSGRVCLGIHGLLHTQQEMLHLSYMGSVNKLNDAMNILDSAGLSYAKVFRGPHWAINEETCKALIDLEFTHLYSHKTYCITEKYEDLINIVHYNWNLKDDYGVFENATQNTDIIVAHGHTSRHRHLNCGNGLCDVYPKIEELIAQHNPKFLRLDEV